MTPKQLGKLLSDINEKYIKKIGGKNEKKK